MAANTITVLVDDQGWQIFRTENRHAGPMAMGTFKDGSTVIDESDFDSEELVYLLVEAAVNGQL